MAIDSDDDDDAEFYNAYVQNKTIRALCKRYLSFAAIVQDSMII